MMRTFNRSFLLTCLTLFSALAWADHLPASMVAIGKPEHVLAGISIADNETIANIIKRLGKPDKFSVTNADYQSGSGERSYEWNRSGVRLRIGTEYQTDAKTKKIIESPPLFVDVWGEQRGGFGFTGRGLSLGAHRARIQTIYGARFQSDVHSVTIQWKDETTLTIDFDNDGRIVHMKLEVAVE